MFKRILCTVLAVCMLSGSLSLLSCTKEIREPKQDDSTLNDKYTIVTGSELDITESAAPKALSDGLAAKGITAEINKDGTAESNEFVILLGQTEWDESVSAYEKLDKIDDFIVDPISKSLIVICGKTPRATEAAVDYFLSEYVSDSKELLIESASIYRQEYEYESVALEDIKIGDYVIAVKSEQQLNTAYRLTYMLGAYSGEAVNIVSYNELTEQNKGVICLSSNGRDPSAPWPEGLDGYFLNLETDDLGATLSILWSNDKYFEDAMAKFEERFAVIGEIADAKVRFTSVTQHKQEIKSYPNAAVNAAEWVVESKIERPIAEGVMQVSYTCKAYNEIPYLVHVMTVDMDHATLMLGTADNRNDVVDKWVQTPIQHAWAARKAGHNVVGGINAGYPTGISIKEGVQMVPGTIHRPYFAVTKSGEPVILYDDNAADYKNLQMAACGTHVIVDNYMPGELAMDEEFSYTTHPRTLIGIRGDGTVVMVVIDGRQPEYSNGSPMVRSADIMMKLGCQYALNLDGGGSSTMIVPKQFGSFEAVNMISDPTMRRVRNSILVVANED